MSDHEVMERPVVRITVGEAPQPVRDTLSGEEPLEMRVNGQSLAVTMRTPGADLDLVLGFLVSEGVITNIDQCVAPGSRHPRGIHLRPDNVVNVTLREDVTPPDHKVTRAFFTTSSCGICGKSSIDAVRTHSAFAVRDDPLSVGADFLASLPGRLRSAQEVFEVTGGLHAAALFDAATGELLVVREDVGRHNAVDKVIGWALQERGLPLSGTILLVSGRASFELVQKALMAGIPVLCAVSAPSSLAVDLAEESGMTLVGFLRAPSMVVYAGGERVRAV